VDDEVQGTITQSLPSASHLGHVEVIHKDDHLLASRGPVHTTPPLVELAINDILQARQVMSARSQATVKDIQMQSHHKMLPCSRGINDRFQMGEAYKTQSLDEYRLLH
jgi:hypothetical protein